MAKPSVRLQACAILGAILRNEGSLSQAFASAQTGVDGTNPALLRELCYGTCRWYHRLHFDAQALLDKPLRSKDNDVYCLILLGLYQLFYMRIPAHAAINETVDDAAALGKPWAKNLVNAVLREGQRRHDDLTQRAQRDYGAWYSHPEWLLTRLKQDWPKHYRDILDANNARAPMTLRVNLARITRPEYLELLLANARPARAGELAASAVVLEAPCDVHELPGFDAGLVSVQDEASQLITQVLPLAPNLRVLDACAAPGGKTCALLEAEPSLHIVALDREERRLPRMRDNLARLGLHADVRCGDITADNDFARESFDRILLDVPCSATGVIRRHPDIKLLRSAAEVVSLCEMQGALLRAAWPLLAPGGLLLYSTCSVLAAENAQQVARFVEAHATAELLPLPIASAVPSTCGIQLLPTPGGPDGFYYALLRKTC
ncbi:MAG TPA: 16S rRNA (cytosine(967)-C(5))-methyltransferase RsmB [Pseudomonadales bacterium]